MPLILAIETSADTCAAALVRDRVTLAQRHEEMSRGHAEALVPMVQNLAAAADVPLSALDLIAVTRGPGSFTGLRTGIAAARGFAIASGAAAIGVSALESVAAGAVRRMRPDKPVLCVLETRRSDYFVQMFDSTGKPLTQPEVCEARAIVDLIDRSAPIVAGNAVARLRAEIGADAARFDSAAGSGVPDPEDIAALACAAMDEGGLASDTLSPLYLRPPEAKLPADGGRLKK